MQTNLYHVGFIDPTQHDEPEENTQGFIAHGTATVNAGARGRILSFSTSGETTIAYWNVAADSNLTTDSPITILADGQTIDEFNIVETCRANLGCNDKVLFKLPALSFVEVLFTNNQGAPIILSIFLMGWRNLRP